MMLRVGFCSVLFLSMGQALAETIHEGVAESAATLRPLQFGVFPYVSTRKLFTSFIPLKKYLEKTLGRPVRMSTAPDFTTYIERARQRTYDLYFAAPHFAAQAEAEFGYRRVSRLMRELDGSIIVARAGSIQSVADLRGSTVLTPDKLAIITFLGEQWLLDNGLLSGIDVAINHSASHNTAILAVVRGDADAAIIATQVFESMPAEISSQLRILANTKKVPNAMFMASPNLSDDEFQQLRKAVLAYTAKGAGKAFFNVMGYGDMGLIRDQDMLRVEPFVKKLHAKMLNPISVQNLSGTRNR